MGVVNELNCCSKSQEMDDGDMRVTDPADKFHGLSFCKNKNLGLKSLHFHEEGSYMESKKQGKTQFEDVSFDLVNRKFKGTINYDDQDFKCEYTLFFDEGFFKTVKPSTMVLKTLDGTVLNTDVQDVLLYERYNP